MGKSKRQAPPSQASSKDATGPTAPLTVDQAFQRLRKHLGEHMAREHLGQAIRAGKVTLWGRGGDGSWFRTKPVFFEQQLLIEADEGPDGWHASVGMQAGKIGIPHFDQYEWAVTSSETDALCMPDEIDRSLAGVRRGRKPYDWDVIHTQCIRFLDNDDIGANQDVNISKLAERLIEWFSEHLGEANTPEPSAMRAKVTGWIKTWQRLRALEK